MRTVERQRETLGCIGDAPRMRHIAEGWALQFRPVVALCGYTLPIIAGFDEKADRGPCSAADCIVCVELARAKGYL